MLHFLGSISTNQLFNHSILAIPGLFILLPVNYYARSQSYQDETQFLRQLTVENVPQGSFYLGVHLCFTWLISLLAYIMLISFYKNYTTSKLEKERLNLSKPHLKTIQSRSILVYGIPPLFRNESKIQSYFNSLDIGWVESVTLCKDSTQLLNAIAKRSIYLKRMEEIYGQYRNKNAYSFWNFIPLTMIDSPLLLEITPLLEQGIEGDLAISTLLTLVQTIPAEKRMYIKTGFMGLFGDKIEVAQYTSQKYQIWNALVVQLRSDSKECTPNANAFVTFQSVKTAVIASQINIASRPFMLLTKCAPEPRDINWSTLNTRLGPFEKLLRSTVLCFKL